MSVIGVIIVPKLKTKQSKIFTPLFSTVIQLKKKNKSSDFVWITSSICGFTWVTCVSRSVNWNSKTQLNWRFKSLHHTDNEPFRITHSPRIDAESEIAKRNSRYIFCLQFLFSVSRIVVIVVVPRAQKFRAFYNNFEQNIEEEMIQPIRFTFFSSNNVVGPLIAPYCLHKLQIILWKYSPQINALTMELYVIKLRYAHRSCVHGAISAEKS